MSYREQLAADRRLVILKLLIEAEGSSNESVIERGLIMLGHRKEVDRAEVRRLLTSLAERDLVTTEMFQDRVMVASITSRGVAVAEGRVTVDGVLKPRLGE